MIENYQNTPEEVAALEKGLWNRVVWLRHLWKENSTLFAKEQSTVDLLNRMAPAFFQMVQGLMLHETMIAISRLLDPARTMGRDNLTMAQLVDVLARHAPSVAAEVRDLLDTVKSKAEPIRDRRNRALAHLDLGLALGHPNAKPVDQLTYQTVEEVIGLLEEILDEVDHHFEGRTTAWDALMPGGDAQWLIDRLRDAEAHRLRRKDPE
jgi:hypothetical protein